MPDMSERLTVREDCLGWSTTIKKGALIGDANAKTIPLTKGQEVEVVGPGLAVEPSTVFVKLGDAVIEVRRTSLAPT